MNRATTIIGDKGSVISRLTSNSTSIRPEKLLDVEAENYTGGVLWCLYFDNVSAIPVNATVATEGFPVQANLGGTLGNEIDISGGIWVWSSTARVLTVVLAASGSIRVILKA